MTVVTMQNSFLAGVLSPEMQARTDIQAYQQGLAEGYNIFVDYHGGIVNRAGTQWCFVVGSDNAGYVSTQDNFTPRLIPFIYEEDQTFVIIFAKDRIFFMLNGGPVLRTAIPIVDITNADPGVITWSDGGPPDVSTGTIIRIEDVEGMTELNNRYFMANNTSNGYLELTDIFTGDNIDTTNFGAYTSGGAFRPVYSIPNPYSDEDLWKLKFVQIRDILMLVNPEYAVKTLTRLSNSNWLMNDVTFESSTVAPTGLALNASFAGSGTEYAYVVTATNEDTGVESLASAEESDSLSYWPAAEDSIRITWSAVTDAAFYSVYRAPVTPDRGAHTATLKGLIGQTRGTSFDDFQIAPDYTITPPKNRSPFDAANKYPSSVAFIQQRVAYAGTNNRPFKVWTTPVGDFTSMARSQPPRDTDALVFELGSTRADPIKNMVPMQGGLLVFTSEAVFHAYGGADGSPLTPYNINSNPVSWYGAGNLAPIAIGLHVLYTQSDNSIIRDLQYNFFAASYESTDLTLLASHFFQDMKIMRWAYANHPWKVLWAVRDDGRLLSLTYYPEQNTFAFCIHETQGFVKDVCVIPEGDEDVPYIAVSRQYKQHIDPYNSVLGTYMTTIERFRSRVITTIEDAWFLDSALATYLRPGTEAIQFSAATGTGVAVRDINSAGAFTDLSVGWVIRAGGGMMTVTAKADNNHITVSIQRPITNLLPNGEPMLAGPSDWTYTYLRSEISGLWHLEGQEVTVLADGGVQGPFTVVDGSFTLDTPASYVVAGLPYESRAKTLRPELQTPEGTAQNKRKNISSVTLRLKDSRGVEVGPSYAEMQTWNPRGVQPLGSPPELITGDEYINIAGFWNEAGQIYLRQTQPLPMQVLGLIPETNVGDL